VFRKSLAYLNDREQREYMRGIGGDPDAPERVLYAACAIAQWELG
jgi:tellurite resistance protein